MKSTSGWRRAAVPVRRSATSSSGQHAAATAGTLVVPVRPRPDPVCLDEDSHWEILHQCLSDTALPLDIRCAGAVLFLFGQEVTRIAALSTDAMAVRNQETVLLLDHVPIRLPAP